MRSWLSKWWYPAFVLVCGTAFLLSACSATLADESEKSGWVDNAEPAVIKLPDGREVTCLLFDGYRQVAVSCDWANAA